MSKFISTDQHKVSFGYKTVEQEEKAKLVHDVFSNVADKYDFMNDVMSLGVQRIWKNIFVNQIEIPISYTNRNNSVTELENEKIQSNQFAILDLAGGTGDISFRILQNFKKSIPMGAPDISWPRIVVCDINEEMLRVGKQRALANRNLGLEWICANGEKLPFENNTFDIITIAFGIRNFTDIPKGLSEMYRVLKPGGRLLCLEFSKVQNFFLSNLYNIWSFNIIPTLGQYFVNDRNSYQYLVESIEKFPSSEEFAKIISSASFENISYTKLTGGIVNIHTAHKQFPS